MTETLKYTTAVILGLLGGAHCIGMCGGIMSALSLSTTEHKPAVGRFTLLLSYNVGRIISYAIAGFLVGILGWFLGGFNKEASMAIRWLAGLMLIVMGLYLSGWWLGLTRLEQTGQRLWRHIQPHAASLLPITTPSRALLVGALWGWLPCGLIYSTLIWAASSANAWHASLLMLCFGLGTVPVLMATGLLAGQLKNLLQHRGVRAAAGVLVMLFGLWTIPGPHQHWMMSTLQMTEEQSDHRHSDSMHP